MPCSVSVASEFFNIEAPLIRMRDVTEFHHAPGQTLDAI